MTAATTWRSKSGIIMFHLAMPSSAAPAAAIRRAVEVFIHQVTSVGTVREVKVSTRAGGEDAEEWKVAGDEREIVQRLAECADVTAVLARCDLRCEDRDGEAFIIPGGLTFWVQLAEIDSPPEEPLEINVTLDTDVYIPKTWGDDRDNRELAMRNAPRFNRFLDALVRETGALIDSVSADDYPGQVDANGIVLRG